MISLAQDSTLLEADSGLFVTVFLHLKGGVHVHQLRGAVLSYLLGRQIAKQECSGRSVLLISSIDIREERILPAYNLSFTT